MSGHNLLPKLRSRDLSLVSVFVFLFKRRVLKNVSTEVTHVLRLVWSFALKDDQNAVLNCGIYVSFFAVSFTIAQLWCDAHFFAGEDIWHFDLLYGSITLSGAPYLKGFFFFCEALKAKSSKADLIRISLHPDLLHSKVPLGLVGTEFDDNCVLYKWNQAPGHLETEYCIAKNHRSYVLITFVQRGPLNNSVHLYKTIEQSAEYPHPNDVCSSAECFLAIVVSHSWGEPEKSSSYVLESPLVFLLLIWRNTPQLIIALTFSLQGKNPLLRSSDRPCIIYSLHELWDH